MSKINEPNYVMKWIFTQLSGSSIITAAVGSNIFADRLIPQGDSGLLLPCAKFFYIDDEDVNTANGNRVLNRSWWQIEVCDMGDSIYGLRAYADEIDNLFQKPVLPTTIDAKCSIMSSIRQRVTNRNDVDNSQRFVFSGGIYVIQAQGV